MTVLVGGGAGYLGSALVRSLQDGDQPVRVLDSMRRERYCTLWNVDDIQFLEGDIRDKGDVETGLNDVDTVFCLADLTNASKSFDREEETKSVNYEGVLHLFDQAREHGVETFIYTSSASVYGNTPGVVDETFDCDPISPYGRYKLRAEHEMLDAAADTDMDVVALRLGTVHGYSVGMRFDTVINYFTYLACQGQPLPVHETALEEHRPYVNVNDVVRAYRFAFDNAAEMDGAAYNVVGKNRRMQSVLETLQDVFPAVDVQETENPTDNVVSYQLSSDRIREHGFEPEYTLRDGIESIKQRLQHLNTVP